MKHLRAQRGFSLVEMLMVMGMASVAAVAVMQIQSAMNKGNARSMGMMERSQFENLVSISHALPEKCAESLATLIGQAATTSSHSISSIRLGSQTLAVDGQSGGLLLKSAAVEIDGFEAGDTMANGSLDLKVEETISGKKQEKQMSIPMAITVDSNNNITGCSSGSSGSDPYYICTALFGGTYDGSSCKGPTLVGSDDAPVNLQLDSMSSYQMQIDGYDYKMEEEDCVADTSGKTIIQRETCTIKWYRTQITVPELTLNVGSKATPTPEIGPGVPIDPPTGGGMVAPAISTSDMPSTDPAETMGSDSGDGLGGGSEGGMGL